MKTHRRKRSAAFLAAITVSAALLLGCRPTPVPASTGADASSPVFDPRPEGMSPIREQYWGTCWAQTGIAATEMYLIRSGMEDNTCQLSVEDVLWWARADEDGNGGWAMWSRDESAFPPAVTGYLTTAGVRLESDIPYFGAPSDGDKEGSLLYGTGENQRPAGCDTAPVQYEITDIVFLKNGTPEQIKDLIVRYGAVGTAYLATYEGFNEETSAAREPFTTAGTNHAVAVIGWDDTFPKERFPERNGKTPEHDGAWIVKNSLGTDYGSDGGVIYISYDDGYLFRDDTELAYDYSIAGARRPLGQKCYLHDQFGAIRSIDYTGDGTAVWANVFDFGKDERISELSFVSWAEGSAYRLYYAPMDGDVPSADESSWILLSEGTIGHAGYTTVSSDRNEAVPEGKGAILFSVTGPMQSVGTEETGLTDTGRTKYHAAKDEGSAFELKDEAFQTAEVPADSARDSAAGHDAESDPSASEDPGPTKKDAPPKGFYAILIVAAAAALTIAMVNRKRLRK